MLEVTQKLYKLIETSIKLPKKGAAKISIGSESAANIKTLAARLLELAGLQDNIPAIIRNPFSNDEDEHRVERALAGANTFGCKIPDVLDAKLDKIARDLEEINNAASLPSRGFSFKTPSSLTRQPTYALAASKHAPRTPVGQPAATPQFRPVLHKKQPPPPSISTLLSQHRHTEIVQQRRTSPDNHQLPDADCADQHKARRSQSKRQPN